MLPAVRKEKRRRQFLWGRLLALVGGKLSIGAGGLLGPTMVPGG